MVEPGHIRELAREMGELQADLNARMGAQHAFYRNYGPLRPLSRRERVLLRWRLAVLDARERVARKVAPWLDDEY